MSLLQQRRDRGAKGQKGPEWGLEVWPWPHWLPQGGG